MAGGREAEPSFRDWVAVFGAILGAFMAVLDIQIVNGSLEYIQGGLSASLDEGTWISTAYLVGEIITIPLTGWLSEVFSTRRYLIGNCILFLCFSVMCGLSTNLGMMIVCRAGQGFTGGVFIPMAMTIVLRCLPQSKQPIGLALFGVTATFAPAIGPTVGGFLTDTYSWHWIFYINLIPGLILIWAIAYGLKGGRTKFELLRNGDWTGIICMAIGLGSLITMLEEGERKDWFGDPLIRDTAIAAAIFIPAFIAIELLSKRPFINLRLLKQPSFASSSTMGLLLGLGLYGTVYLLPVYLAQIQGYDAMQIGEVIMWYGLPQLLIFPFVPWTMRLIDSRIIVGFGLALFAVSCFMDAYMSHDWALPQFIVPQLVRAAGQPFVIVPLSGLAAGGQPPEEQADASAIFNIMRNLGGSIGIAMLATFITFREQFHFDVLRDVLSQNSLRTSMILNDYTHALAAKTPAGAVATHMQALSEMANTVRREAFVMAYSDCFFIIGVALVLCILALVLVKKPPEGATAAAH